MCLRLFNVPQRPFFRVSLGRTLGNNGTGPRDEIIGEGTMKFTNKGNVGVYQN